MSLAPGARIGPYEVLGTLGAGGMGEVYQARDTRLNRSVALKILPAAFASDPDRLARFKREAQVRALRQVSNGGGAIPYWTKQGREIVYLSGKALMAVDVTPEGQALTLGTPRQLFEKPFAEPVNAVNYDAYPDGNRFVVLMTAAEKATTEPRTHLTMVFNLLDEIRRIAGKN
jgi:serine/threonine protein kinase